MSKKEDLLARIRQLEDENGVLQQTIYELQQEQEKQNQYPFCTSPTLFHHSPLDYIASEFWLQPADNFWSIANRKPRRRDPRWGYFQEDFPGFVAGGDLTFNCGIAAEDSRDENDELRQKVGELKKEIEKLEKKLKDSPLKYVVNAIKDKARYDSPSAAYQLFEKQDYIFKDCEQWQENVKELKDFLLREKNNALLPPKPIVLYPTDEQMADAISSICGEGKALDDKQKWLGVCCLVRARYNYPYDIEACCKRLASLPYKKTLYKECDYGNVRKLAVYGFAREPYEKWNSYTPRETEKKYFYNCFYVARELENAIEKITNND